MFTLICFQRTYRNDIERRSRSNTTDSINGIVDSTNIFDQNRSVTLVRQQTLFYLAFYKVFKRSKTESAKISNYLLNWKFHTFLFVIFCVIFGLKIFKGPDLNGSSNIFLICIVIMIATFWMCNLNKDFFWYKKFSLALIWKMYNFLTMSIAIWIIERSNKIDEFNQNKTIIEGDIISTINLIGWFVGSIDIALLHGMFFTFKVRAGILFFIMLFLMYRATAYYFNADLDKDVKILNQIVSMRHQVVNRSLDLAFWIGYQTYQLFKYPHHFQLRAKLEIHWSRL